MTIVGGKAVLEAPLAMPISISEMSNR